MRADRDSRRTVPGPGPAGLGPADLLDLVDFYFLGFGLAVGFRVCRNFLILEIGDLKL